jgi:hypothetical protein
MRSMSQRRSDLLSRIHAAPSQGTVASPGKSPASKRSASQVSLAPSQGNKLKTADDPGSDDEDNSNVSNLPHGKRCSGCLRVCGVDKSYYVTDKPFAWLYADGRGEWCKDCGNTFRLLYKNVMSLPTFTRWLRDHRVEFLGNLLAVVTLRKEGIKHVTAEAVQKRVEFLTWCYGISGYPYPLAAVHVLAPFQVSVKAVRDWFVVPGLHVELCVLVPRPVSQILGQKANQLFVTRSQKQIAWPLSPISEAPPSVQSWWAMAKCLSTSLVRSMQRRHVRPWLSRMVITRAPLAPTHSQKAAWTALWPSTEPRWMAIRRGGPQLSPPPTPLSRHR